MINFIKILLDMEKRKFTIFAKLRSNLRKICNSENFLKRNTEV